MLCLVITIKTYAQVQTISNENVLSNIKLDNDHSIDILIEKEIPFSLLTIKNLSASTSKKLEEFPDLKVKVSGINANGKEIFPVLLNHGMKQKTHYEGNYYLSLFNSKGSAFAFSEKVVSVQLLLDKGIYDSASIEFEKIQEIKKVSRITNDKSCKIDHLAVMIDDSKSNEEELSFILEELEEYIEKQTKAKTISIISLNVPGKFKTVQLVNKNWKRDLNTFISLEKSKYTNWENGFSNVQIVQTLEPINYLLVIADGFTNNNGAEESLLNGMKLINSELNELNSISTEFLYVTNEDINTTKKFLSSIFAFDNISVEKGVEFENLNLSKLEENCNEYQNNYSIFLSPNPTSNTLFINGLDNLLHDEINVKIISSQGNTLDAFKILKESSQTLSLESFPNGVYFIEISINKEIIKTQRIVKIN